MLNHVRLTCVLALSAVAVSAQTVSVPPINRSTGMVGIADSQTAQLNLLNLGPAPTATAAVCAAVVSFVDANGVVLKSTTLAVAPGKSMSFDLRSDADLQLAVGARREIRAAISIPSVIPVVAAGTATPAAVPACRLVTTLEILDTVSGRTLVVLGHTREVLAPPVATPATNQ